MTGPEHYRKAENWLFKAENPGAQGETETPESCAAIAHVHAQLALAATLAVPSAHHSQWGKTVGAT